LSLILTDQKEVEVVPIKLYDERAS
jgi:hypothetical protein